MAALKEVRQRIKAVRGIQQVTKAMKTVASVKMKRVQDHLLKTRPYVDGLYDMASKLAVVRRGDQPLHRLLGERQAGAEAIVVVGSDRGLCGSFNTNLFRFVLREVRGTTPTLILVGRKARNFFVRQPMKITKTYERLPLPMTWEEAEKMARDLVSLYSFSQLAKIQVAYQQFVSPGVSRPTLAPWLPFKPGESARGGEVRCEPSVAAVLDLLLPRALTAQLYRTLLESQTSEQGARMVAMDNASSNAAELQDDLTLLFNKLRQTGITKELLEITTGAEALKN